MKPLQKKSSVQSVSSGYCKRRRSPCDDLKCCLMSRPRSHSEDMIVKRNYGTGTGQGRIATSKFWKVVRLGIDCMSRTHLTFGCTSMLEICSRRKDGYSNLVILRRI